MNIIALVCLAVCTILDSFAYIPQIIQLVKTKSSKDINLSSWMSWFISYLSYLVYILIETPEAGMIFLTLLNIILIAATYLLSAYYKRRRPHKKHL